MPDDLVLIGGAVAFIVLMLAITTSRDWRRGTGSFSGAGARSDAVSRRTAGERWSLIRRGQDAFDSGDRARAVGFWVEAAALGHDDTWTRSGVEAHERGDVLGTRIAFAKAAKNGNKHALTLVGHITEMWGDQERDSGVNPVPGLSNYYASAEQFYRRAADQHRDSDAMVRLCDLLKKTGRADEGGKWLIRAWKTGNGEAAARIHPHS